MSGTVFPFVHFDLSDIDQDTVRKYEALFPVIAQLYALPPTEETDPVTAVLNTTALFTDTARFYDPADGIWYPDMPMHPRGVYLTNHPGIPIHWNELFNNLTAMDTTPDNTPLLRDASPTAPMGIFTFTDVPAGKYVLVLSRAGFVTRFAEVEVENNEEFTYLGHRELVLGDVFHDFIVKEADDVPAIKSNFGIYGINGSIYNPKYDVNADLEVNDVDVSYTRIYIGFTLRLYSDTRRWLLKYE
jgi:hypothetical protein